MYKKNNLIITICSFLVLAILIIFGTYQYILKKQESLLTSIYKNEHQNIISISESLIKDKLNTTLAIALSLAKDEKLFEFIENKEYEKLNYEKIINEIIQYSKYKDVWIQVIDKNGNSIYRSWTDKKGDNLLFRKDLKTSLTNQDVSTSISVGIFNLTLKARTPIFDSKNNFLGALEIITHFDSITKDLKENNINSVVITEKKYKETIKFPYTNIFVEDYYIANKNVDLEYIQYLKSNNIENYINISDFIIENNFLISKFTLFDKNNEKLAYILSFKKLENVDLQIIKSFKIQIIMTSVIALIMLFFSFLFYLYTSYLKNIKLQERKKQSILDSQSNIIVITDGLEIIDANQKLIEFFTDVEDLNEFKEKYNCICKTFIDMNDELYILDKNYNGKNWAEYALSNKNKDFKVAIKDQNEVIQHFTLKVSKIKSENYIIATFTNITQEIIRIEKDKEKDRLLFQQSKIAAIADTLKNIAHQWRQPLSVISTIASGMKIKKDLNLLDETEFKDSCNAIIDNTKKLSDTIENFTNFFDKDDNITNFSFVESINETLHFFDSIFEKNSIKYIFNYDKDFILKCNKNDFTQALLNILDNSIYALINNKKEDERFIFINLNNKILEIKDSGNGIDENILSKILEPYFTTKHQAFGVGLGLYVVQEFFVKTLNYKIQIKNVTFDYKNKNYSGANFIIDFN